MFNNEKIDEVENYVKSLLHYEKWALIERLFGMGRFYCHSQNSNYAWLFCWDSTINQSLNLTTKSSGKST